MLVAVVQYTLGCRNVAGGDIMCTCVRAVPWCIDRAGSGGAAVSIGVVARASCGHLVLKLVNVAAFCLPVAETDVTLRKTEELLRMRSYWLSLVAKVLKTR